MTKRAIGTAMLLLLVLLNIFFLWQNHDLKKNAMTISPPAIYLATFNEGFEADVRGIYTYPGLGGMFAARDADGFPMSSQLTLALFFSTKSPRLFGTNEVEAYRRLLLAFHPRGQQIVAVSSPEDSSKVADSLKALQLDIPLITYYSSSRVLVNSCVNRFFKQRAFRLIVSSV